MDEPTNHIDHQTKQRLAERIMTMSVQIFLVISHENNFLNEIAYVIVEIHNGKATMYEGNYDNYTKQRVINNQSQQHQFAKYEKKRKKWKHGLQQCRNAPHVSTIQHLDVSQARKRYMKEKL